MTQQETQAQVNSLICERKWEQLITFIKPWPIPDVADTLLQLDKPERVLLFRVLPRPLAAEVFAYLHRQQQDALLTQLTDAETRQILRDMRPDDRTALLGEFPGEVSQRLMNLLDPADLEEARWLLGFPESSIGRLMTPDYIAVRPDWTIEQVLAHIRTAGERSETLDQIFVINTDGRLCNSIHIRQILLSAPGQRVEDLSTGEPVYLSAYDDREVAVHKMRHYDQFVLPVVGSDGFLLGIITADDVMDVADQETTEDIHKQAGVDSDDTDVAQSAELIESSIPTVIRLRLPWLMVALAGGLGAALIMGVFEDALEAVVVLAFFIPLIMDMGGNVGTQSSTIFVRGVSVGHIKPGEIRKHLIRETLLGLSIGVIIGTLAGAAAFLWRGMFDLSLVIFLSMVAVCTIASLIGYGVPWLVRKLGYDPATVSNPFITTIKDISALTIYFSLATLLLGQLMS